MNNPRRINRHRCDQEKVYTKRHINATMCLSWVFSLWASTSSSRAVSSLLIDPAGIIHEAA